MTKLQNLILKNTRNVQAYTYGIGVSNETAEAPNKLSTSTS